MNIVNYDGAPERIRVIASKFTFLTDMSQVIGHVIQDVHCGDAEFSFFLGDGKIAMFDKDGMGLCEFENTAIARHFGLISEDEEMAIDEWERERDEASGVTAMLREKLLALSVAVNLQASVASRRIESP